MADTIGSLIIDLEGTALSSEEEALLQHPLVGGVLLFSRNFASPEQLTMLCQAIRETRKQPLLLMVDQEGGRVQRFINGFTRLPSMSTLGKYFPNDLPKACEKATDCGWLMASELLAVGIDLSLAPVLDLNKGKNTVIGDRAFHADPNVVIALAQAFILGMREAGMAATGKHFPGHGSVSVDSHIAMPVDKRFLSEIEQDDMLSFTGLVKTGISAIMAAHIIFPNVDTLAVGFSRVWLQDILRKKLGFKGVVLSDDLNMEGANISANYAERVIAAREAGCDFALLCNNRRGVITVLETVPSSSNQVNREKWSLLQGNLSRQTEPYRDTKRWQRTREFLLNEA